ncbi:MAG: translocation/assembly module TamB domain-containing protein, partial [Acidobacteria bacterium]|nr:translocation/assembly module TamB domain-containing protein [Acidobacteriota bacterium]
MTPQPRRSARVKRILLVAAAVSVPIAVSIILKSDWMAGRVAARLIHEIEEISGREVDLDGVTLRFLPPGIDLRGLHIKGSPPAAGSPRADAPPLLSLRRGGVRLKVLPLFAGAWIPDAVELDGLDIHLSGNGPPDRGEGEGIGAAGRIAIPRLSVRDGHVTYGAPASQIHFEADDLNLTMRPVTCHGGGCVEGELSGKQFAVTVGSHRLTGSALGIDLEARDDVLTIRRVKVEGPDLTIGGEGILAFGEDPDVSASARLSAQGQSLSDLIGDLPLRAERLDARVEIRMEEGALTVAGTSSLVGLRYGELAEAARVDAQFSVRKGGTTIDLEATGLLLPLGRLTPIGTGSGTARVSVASDGKVRATLSIDSIRYGNLLGVLHPEMPLADIAVQGEGEIRLDRTAARVTGGFFNLEVRPVGLRGVAPLAGVAGGPASLRIAPHRERVDMSGRARLEITPDAFDIRDAEFILDGIRASAQGRITRDASSADLDLAFERADLSRVLGMMPRHPTADAVARTFGGGSASGTMHMSIRDGSLRATGRWKGEGLILSAGIDPLDPFDASLDWSLDPARLILSRIDLSGPGWSTEGLIEIDIRDGLKLHAARLSLDRMPASPIWSLAGTDLVAGGVVSGRLVLDPDPTSDGHAGSAVDLVFQRPRMSGVELDRVVVRGSGSGETLRIDSLLLEVGDARIEARGDYDMDRARLRLDLIETDIDLAPLDGLLGHIPGVTSGRISPTGSLAIDPQRVTFRGAARGEALRLADLPIGDLNISSIAYDTAADPVLVMTFTADALAITGGVTWSAATGIGTDLTFEETPLDPLRALLAGTVGGDVSGFLSGTLHAAMPLDDFSSGRLELGIEKAELTYGAIRVVSSSPSRLVYRDRRWHLDRIHVEGDGTDLDLSGIWDTRSGAPATGSVAGRLDASLLTLLVPDLVARGVVDIEIAMRALDSGLEYSGRLEVRDAAFGHAGIPLSLDRLALSATVAPDGAILIDRLEGILGGGSVTGSGRCELDGLAIRSCSLELSGKDMQTEPAPELVVFFDGRATLDVDSKGASLAGQIDVLRALYTVRPDVSFKALLGNGPSAGSLVGGEAPFLLALDLRVNAPGEIWVRGENVMLEGAARMTIAGTSAAPEVAGRISVFEGGRIVFRDVPYTSEEGTIDFDSPDGINPSLNMSAVTRVGDYEIRLRVLERASDPRVELTSDPTLASRDIVFLLLTGETYEDSFTRGTGTAFLAEEQVGQYLIVPVSRVLGKTIAEPLGLTTVQIEPQFLNSTADPTARLTVTKRISPDLNLTFSNDLGDSQAQIYRFDYRIGRRWSFV